MKFNYLEIVMYQHRLYYYIDTINVLVGRCIIQDYIHAKRVIVSLDSISKVSSNRELVSILERE